MGAEESHVPLQPVPQDFGYLAVVFKMPDHIRVIHGNEAEHSIIYHSILDTWKEGIKARKRKCAGSVLCFKLNGLPYETGILSMNIREVVCRILRCLHNIGWQHIVSTNLTGRREWFTLIFARKDNHQRIGKELAFIAMSSTDKLHLWNLNQDTRYEISRALVSDYAPGLYSNAEVKEGTKSYEAWLKGSPWSLTTSLPGAARGILIKIFSIMMKRYSFHCAINVKRTGDAFVFFPRPIPSNAEAEFFIISLYKTSILQVFQAPEYLISIIHKVIQDAFAKKSHKIEKTIDYQSGKVAFKYSDHAKSDPSSHCTMTKFIVCNLLEALKSQGWSIVTGFDMTRGMSSKTELLFQKGNPHPNCKVFCLSPVLERKLCVINAPQRILEVCRDVISKHLKLVSETHNDFPVECVSFEFGDPSPWSDSGDGAHFAHSMLCHLLDKLFHEGFKINLTADVIPECIDYDEGASTSHDPNAWWFMHEPQIGMSAASSVPESKEEPLSQSAFENASKPLSPTAPQFYEAPPPSYEMATKESEQKRN